jgi:hypothetical protein
MHVTVVRLIIHMHECMNLSNLQETCCSCCLMHFYVIIIWLVLGIDKSADELYVHWVWCG